MSKTLSVKGVALRSDFLETLKSIAARRLAIRSNVRIAENAKSVLSFGLCPSLPEDGYRISDAADGLMVESSTECGLLAALGHLLRDGTLSEDDFTIGSFRGEIVPKKPFRSIYFATHFHNYYHDAPIEEILYYIEDLSLWGLNTICFWFDLHHYSSCKDPDASAMITRIKQMMAHAERLGIKTMLLLLANEMFAGSPEELRAEWQAQGSYHGELMGHYHIEACPSKPGGMELILNTRRQMLEAFADTPPSYITIWPYDQGGCTCAECAPWGANGYLRTAQALKPLIHSLMPETKIVLSAWYFDHFTTGEWDAFIEAVKQGDYAEWVDYLVLFFHEDAKLPEAIVAEQSLAGIPLIGFPEISMYGAMPWGGFGANPLPGMLSRLWKRDCALLSGGYPYSEGIYEDLNKIAMLSFYTGRHPSVMDAIEEYARFEFSAEHAKEIAAVIALMEHTLIRWQDEEAGKGKNKPARFVLHNVEQVDEIHSRVCALHQALGEKAKVSWRWKILYYRAMIDYELYHNDFFVSEQCERYFEELTALYHAEQANFYVAPPTVRSLKKTKEFYLV